MYSARPRSAFAAVLAPRCTFTPVPPQCGGYECMAGRQEPAGKLGTSDTLYTCESSACAAHIDWGTLIQGTQENHLCFSML